MMRASGWAAALAALMLTSAADAAVYRFTISGAFNAQFEIDGDRTPDSIEDGFRLSFYDVPGLANTVNGIADVDFNTADWGGGLYLIDFAVPTYIFASYGEQLFEGPMTRPVFKTGTFTLQDYWGNDDPYTLTISQVGVPEPATWAMMIGGFALVGAASRSRRKLGATFASS